MIVSPIAVSVVSTCRLDSVTVTAVAWWLISSFRLSVKDLAGFYHDLALNKRAKSRLVDFNLIAPRWQLLGHENKPSEIGCDNLLQPALLVGDHDGNAGDDGATGVHHRARDAPSFLAAQHARHHRRNIPSKHPAIVATQNFIGLLPSAICTFPPWWACRSRSWSGMAILPLPNTAQMAVPRVLPAPGVPVGVSPALNSMQFYCK